MDSPTNTDTNTNTNTDTNTDTNTNTNFDANKDIRIQKIFATATTYYQFVPYLTIDPSTIRFIDPRFRSNDICNHVMNCDSTMCKYFPHTFFTAEISKKLVEKNGLNIKYIPGEFLNENMYIMAIKNNVEAFKLVPHTFRTLAVCQEAYIKDQSLLKEFPKQIKKSFI